MKHVLKFGLAFALILLFSLPVYGEDSKSTLDVVPIEQDIFIGDDGQYNITVKCSSQDVGQRYIEVFFYDDEMQPTDNIGGILTFDKASTTGITTPSMPEIPMFLYGEVINEVSSEHAPPGSLVVATTNNGKVLQVEVNSQGMYGVPVNNRLMIPESESFDIKLIIDGDEINIGTFDWVSGEVRKLDLYYDPDEPAMTSVASVSAGDVNLTLVDSDTGYLNYSWNAPQTGNYDFLLTVWFNDGVEAGDEFPIIVKDHKVQHLTASAKMYAIAIPELLTAVLVAAGILLIGFARKR